MSAVRLAIIGFGIMGERLARAALDYADGPIAIAGVWDPAAAARQRLASALPRVPSLGSAEDAIAAADCIYIAAPPAFHLSHARAALAAGKPVLTEKPLSSDTEDARRFRDEVAAGGPACAVNFIFASSPAVAQLRAWREADAIGALRAMDIEVDFAAWPRPWQMAAEAWLSKRAQGGFTREVISHFLFIAQRFAGPLQVEASTVDYPDGDGCERRVAARLLAGEVPVSLSGRVGGTQKDDHNIWYLEGEAGAIRLRDWSIAERRGEDGNWSEAPDAMANELARPLVLRGQLDKLAALARGEAHELATVDEALSVQEIVEAILAA